MNWWTGLVALASVLGSVHGQCDSETITTLNIFKSEVTTPGTTDNNLQNGGRLVYKNAGRVNQAFGPDKKLSLIITKQPGTTYFSTAAGGPAEAVNSNGKNGQFGSINIKNNPDQNPGQIGEGRFNFCVVDAETEEPMDLDFNFFFFDLDNRNNKKGLQGLQEQLEVFGYHEILETDVKPKTYNLEEKSDRAVVKATALTGKNDNPSDPNNLTNIQLGKSIGFSFKSTSCFKANLLLKCPSNKKKCNSSGANILFTGQANQIVPEPCPDPPTGSPTSVPTIGPTTGPTTGPTAEPTVGPTAGPTAGPIAAPTAGPTSGPTAVPTISPTAAPTIGPTVGPTGVPTISPTAAPTIGPTAVPTAGGCPVFEEGTGTSVCGAGENIVRFLGGGSQCETSGLSGDGEDPFYDIEFLPNHNIAFKVRNPFAPDGGQLFVDFKGPLGSAVASRQQCVRVEECSSESLEVSCTQHVDAAFIMLYYVTDGVTCAEDTLKAVPECCLPEEEEAGTPALVLSYLVRCSCPAETATR